MGRLLDLRGLEAIEAASRRLIASGVCSCVCCGGSATGSAFALGNRRPGEPHPVAPDAESLFEIASVSKIFTAHLAALLWESGKLDLDKPVFGGASVRMLAAHASGFTDAALGRLGVYRKPWPFPDDGSYVRAVRALRPVRTPGTRTAYACVNMILLGFVLEDVSGCDLETLARRLLWEPLGMRNTTWLTCGQDPRTVRMYTHGALPLGTKGDENARNVRRPLGNAGIHSCLSDLLRYADDFTRRATFAPAVYDLLAACQTPAREPRRSFGWDLDAAPPGWPATTLAHAGYTGQYLALEPRARRYAVVLTNLNSDRKPDRALSYRARKHLSSLLGAQP